MKKYWILCFFSCCLLIASGQDPDPGNRIRSGLLHGEWPAHWITCPGASQRAYGVYHFRKTFALAAVPGRFIVHLSADNRYRLFVNGQAVCSGPARGDLAHWNFETVDLAHFLQNGDNAIAAVVWNMGEYAAVGQISNQTAFLVQGDSATEELVNTNSSWKVIRDSAYQPCALETGAVLRTYYVAGPGDEVDGAKYPWGWEQTAYADAHWPRATSVAHPAPTGFGTDNQWTLVPRSIPLMEEVLQRIPLIRRSGGRGRDGDAGAEGGAVRNGKNGTVGTGGNGAKGGAAGAAFVRGDQPFTVAAHDSVVLLLDQTVNTVAYPQLLVSYGKGSTVQMTYAEALFGPNFQKGNRNEIAGKEMRGDYDLFRPDGGSKRLFRPLWMRTYRYLQLTVVTGDEPLTIEDLYGMYTGYPFRERASFSCNDSSLQTLWDIGWRTARLCAGETYFDCPYYEQLQYEGDTRIQALISLYVSGDDRLMRKAITDFLHSRVSEGLTQGRYPSNRLQVIPPFSLYWISMIYDYWMHRKDDAFIRQNLFAIKGVFDWYEKRIDPDKKMLGPMDWWNFADWNAAFPNGVPDGATDGHSSVLSLQLAYTLQEAAPLFRYFHDPATADHYTDLANQLASETYRWCFDPVKGLMANSPEKSSFSQHANIMGVLAGSIPIDRAKAVMSRVLSDTSLSQCTFYYRFYLTRALNAAGMADLYYASLQPWRGMVANGLTTFAENPDPTRSDCHAWSASPVYDFLATICGITPAAPGFHTVSIRPAMGELKEIHGSMPHPMGVIRVSLMRKGANGVSGEIELPPSTEGSFYWKDRKISLHPGKQKINL